MERQDARRRGETRAAQEEGVVLKTAGGMIKSVPDYTVSESYELVKDEKP